MDKHTLSNYGWLVILTLVLSVMIAFATPFGQYVQTGAQSISDAIISANNDAVNENSLKSNNNIWDAKLQYGIVGNIGTYYFDKLEDVAVAIGSGDYSKSTNNKQSNVAVIIQDDITVVKLQKDINLISSVSFTTNVIIDLNKKTITANESTILFPKTSFAKICNGNINKSITENPVNRSSIGISGDSNVTIENINFKTENKSKKNSTIINVSTGCNNVLVNNCNFISECGSYQNNGDDTQMVCNIYVSNNSGIVNIKNSDMSITGALCRNIYCLNSIMNIEDSSVITTETVDIENESNWASYSILCNKSTININRSNTIMNSTFCNSTSVVYNQGGVCTIENSHIESNVEKISEETNYSYALQIAHNATMEINNCNVIVNAKCTQSSAARCQSTGVFKATNSKLIINCDAEDNAINAGHIGYALFMNGYGENEMHIKNCIVKGEMCVYGKATVTNIYTEENVKYEAIDRIYH